MKQKLTVLLADDHKLLRSGLKLLLQRNPDLLVVGEAADGEETLRLFGQLEPDILLLDLSMPNMDGMECLREIKSRRPDAKVIVLTMHEDENYIRKAMRLGASGYIPKGSADDELLDAIRTVAAGRFYLSPNAEQSLLSSLFAGGDDEEENPIERLSPRELEVFEYLVHGYTITEIGEKLRLSVKTIDTHKSKILEKLGCKKRSELVSLALRYHVLQAGDAVRK